MSMDTTVSLEDHLSQALKPLLSILPPDLCNTLATELHGSEIHASILYQISRWARTDAARSSLKSSQLDPRAYDNVVSLMAGTRTAPNSVPPPNPKTVDELAHEENQRARNDKRALAMVLNGSLSVICSGAAAWWTADKAGWRDEWKVLLALILAAVVGVAETVLFVIWQSRTNDPASARMKRRRQQRALTPEEAEDDGEKPHAAAPYTEAPSPDDQEPKLRRRTGRKARR